MLFLYKRLEHPGFWLLLASWNLSPMDTEGELYILFGLTSPGRQFAGIKAKNVTTCVFLSGYEQGSFS